MRDHVVEDHEALDRPAERHPLAEPDVPLLDGLVERDVVQVVDARLAGAAQVGRHELATGELGEKVDQLLPADDARERTVLPAQKDAGMQHHLDQEGGLALRKSEVGDPRDPLLVGHRNSSTIRGFGLRPDRPPRPPIPALMR